MTSLADISGIYPSTRLYKPSDVFVSPTTTVGIEIEVEEVTQNLNLNQELWHTTDDGSLRNHGVELVSTPVFGEDIIAALTEAERELVRVNARITSRCGLHIHIDVSGLTTDQLVSMTCALALAEKTLYRYVGVERRDCVFCLPLSDTAQLLPFYNAIKYGHDRHTIVGAIKKTQKYSGFNILPILTQGSIEFRHHTGTFSTEAIISWINIVMGIREAGVNYSATTLVDMPYNEIIRVLFGSRAEELCGSTGERDFKDGWLVAKDILNFNKLEEVWGTIMDVYVINERVNLRGTN
jgi:hypothetical protein